MEDIITENLFPLDPINNPPGGVLASRNFGNDLITRGEKRNNTGHDTCGDGKLVPGDQVQNSSSHLGINNNVKPFRMVTKAPLSNITNQIIPSPPTLSMRTWKKFERKSLRTVLGISFWRERVNVQRWT